MLPILVVITGIRSAVADWSDVPTGSMKPSILEGDRVVINKLAYSLRFPLTLWHLLELGEPARGDVVVFKSPHDGKRLVKRVVAVAGDSVEMRNNELWINGAPIGYEPVDAEMLAEVAGELPAASRVASEALPGHPHPVMALPGRPALRSFDPVVVPADHFFALGDSRDDSFDSRFFGPVHRSQLFGRATHVAFSVDRDHYHLPRWNRFFQAMP